MNWHCRAFVNVVKGVPKIHIAQTERVHDGNSPPKAERAVFLPDPKFHWRSGRKTNLLIHNSSFDTDSEGDKK
ncbi:MAG: hypothetical protein JRJ41_08875 [Deltaproteobacteria bacterium]|nr:hypothetical protein [Deltaproteobacteria bacterium]